MGGLSVRPHTVALRKCFLSGCMGRQGRGSAALHACLGPLTWARWPRPARLGPPPALAARLALPPAAPPLPHSCPARPPRARPSAAARSPPPAAPRPVLRQPGMKAAQAAGEEAPPGVRSVKVVLVGDGGCGKTSLLLVFRNGAFPEVSAPAHGLAPSRTGEPQGARLPRVVHGQASQRVSQEIVGV
jgi:hypothetical protein